MKKNILLTATTLLMICFLMPVLGTLQNSLNISAYGAIKYYSFKIGIYGASWNFAEFDAQTIANTFDMSQSAYVYDPANDYAAKMNQVHALNPKYKALVYRNVASIYNYWTDEWDLAESNGWLLKDASGNYVVSARWPENYLVDITNPDYQKWVANKIKSWIEERPFFDGVMVDNGLTYKESDWEGIVSARPINPLTGTYFTWDEIKAGYVQLLSEMIDTLGSSKIVLPNGIWNGHTFYDYPNGYTEILSQVPQLSGVFSEAIFYRSYSTYWYTEEEWLKSLNMLVWVQDNLLKNNPENRFNGYVPVTSQSLPAGTSRGQLMMFGFCSMMLGIKYSEQNTIGFGREIYNYSDLLSLAQKLRSVDMIEPLSDYYKIASTSVYGRNFTRGEVLVNPTDVSYTVALDGSYTTFEGSTVSGSLTINGHTGVILFR